MIKRALFLFLLSFTLFQADAQQPVSLIQAGTKIDYRFFLYGQTAAISFTVKSMTDSVQLDWSMRGYASGSYLISAAGFERGIQLNFLQPANQTVLRLASNETFAIISKAAFNTLKKDKQFVYNHTTYVLLQEKEPPFKIAEQELEVLHVKGLEEAGELWILNDPSFPLICQFKDNPLGINFKIVGLK